MQEYTGEVIPLEEYTGKNILSNKRSILDNITGGIVEPIMQVGSSMIAKPISEIMGMSAAAKDYLTGQDGDAVGFKNDIANALTYQPRTQGGKFISENILAPIGNVVESGANKLASSVTDNPIAQSGLKETALQALGITGAKFAPKTGNALRDMNIAKVADLASEKASQATTNAIREAGQKIGLIAPSEGSIKQTVSNLGGAQPYIGIKNRQVITDRLASEVGLPTGSITDADIAARVSQLGSRYKAVEKAIGTDLPISPQFGAEIQNILTPMQEMFSQDPIAFASFSQPIKLLEQQLQSGSSINTAIALKKISKLREDARTLAKDNTGDLVKKETSKANLEIANLYEDLIDAELQKTGKTAIGDSWRDARKKLSQIHLIDSARAADDLIDPQKFASVVGKYADKKKFVTGDFKTIADFANTFKPVTQNVNPTKTPSRWEILAATTGIVGTPATGGMSALMALPTAVRALAPSMGKRGMLQGGTPSYNLPITKGATQIAIPTGMLGTALSPYVKEEQ